MVMYGAVLPSYKYKKDKGKGKGGQKAIKVDDPANRDKLNNFLKRFE